MLVFLKNAPTQVRLASFRAAHPVFPKSLLKEWFPGKTGQSFDDSGPDVAHVAGDQNFHCHSLPS